MKKNIVLILFLNFWLVSFSQLKYLNFEDDKVSFVLKTTNLSPQNATSALTLLESDSLNSDFNLVDSVSISFLHKLTDYKKLNQIENELQNVVNEFGAKIKFYNLGNIKNVLDLYKVGVLSVFVSDLETAEKENSLENFMLNESKFYLVNADSEQHHVYIVYDLTLSKELVIDILRSQGKKVIDQEDFKKYYPL
jgi:hypothetical protein